MPFDPVTTPITRIKRIAKRMTYAPRRDWLDRLMNEPAPQPKPPGESQLVRDLRAALSLLLAHGWTMGTFARTATSVWCQPTDEAASSFCAGGAIFRAVLGIQDQNVWHSDHPAEQTARIDAAFAHLSRYTGGRTLAEFNDDSGAFKVIGLFERAITDAVAGNVDKALA